MGRSIAAKTTSLIDSEQSKDLVKFKDSLTDFGG